MSTQNQAMQRQNPQQSMMERANNEVASIHRGLEKIRPQVLSVLKGDKAEAERLIMSALLVVKDTPAVRECTPATVVKCVLKCAILGLDLSAGLGEGYLVPFKNKGIPECTLMIGYRGWQKKAAEAGYTIVAEPVYHGDGFEFTKVPLHVKHAPLLKESERGELIGAYAVALDPGTGRVLQAVWVTTDDLDAARKLADKGRPSPAWNEWPDRMRRKLAINRLCRDLVPGVENPLAKLLAHEVKADDKQQDDIRPPADLPPRIDDPLEQGSHGFGFTDPDTDAAAAELAASDGLPPFDEVTGEVIEGQP